VNTSQEDVLYSVEGSWRFSMRLDQEELPFNANFHNDGSRMLFSVYNDDEEITATSVDFQEDSIIINLPYFQSVLACRVESPDLITGSWLNLNKKDYSIPFIAERGKDFRFTNSKSSTRIADRYKVEFDTSSDNPWDAILLLENKEGSLSGTFLTETGDYRYLQGNIMNGKVYLSSFDGGHAFLFEATIDEDSLTNGIFKSGKHYETNWKAVANSDFQLSSPTSLTYLKDGFEHIDFSLPNQDGKIVSWSDLELDNKVVIIDIMGSWCPNCMDASVAIHSLRNLYPEDQVELVTIAFELTDDFELAKQRITKMQKQLGVEEKFLFGGLANKEKASAQLPMLNHIMSYPTLIFVGSDRKVAQIYTGFYGPGTGIYYDQFLTTTKGLLDSLLDKNHLAGN
jgi:thiol-disulfide isomerase/thioredoxin